MVQIVKVSSSTFPPCNSTESARFSIASCLLDNAVSPYGLALTSYGFFLVCCLIPPSVYRGYVREPDFMFLDPPTILFYTSCVAGFMGGASLVNWIYPSKTPARDFVTKFSPVLFLLIPLILGVVATMATNVYLITHYPEILVSILANQGAEVKEKVSFQIDGHFALVPLALVGVTWWALWRYSDLGLRGWRKWLIIIFLSLAVLSLIASSIITVDRNMLTLAICGLAVSYLAKKVVKKQMTPRFFAKSVAGFLVVMVTLFVGFSSLRGVGGSDDQMSMIFGYTAASYNRLAAIVNGNLQYPFAGRGIYLSSLAAHNHYLLSDYLGSPEATDVWTSEFVAVARSGLDGGLIWSGAFGYIYSDLGWFSAAFLFAYGMLYAAGWKWIKHGSVFGIVLYPWFGFCVLFWIGFNYLLDRPIEALTLVALLLTAYEFLFAKARRPRPTVRTACIDTVGGTIAF